MSVFLFLDYLSLNVYRVTFFVCLFRLCSIECIYLTGMPRQAFREMTTCPSHFVPAYTSEEVNSKISLEFSSTWICSQISVSHCLSGS